MVNNCYSEFAFYCEPNEIEKLQSFQDFITNCKYLQLYYFKLIDRTKFII